MMYLLSKRLNRRYFKLTRQLSIYTSYVVFCLCLAFSGCASPEQTVGYVRTKNLKVSGNVTAMLNTPVITVTWDFQEYSTHKENDSFFSSGVESIPVLANDCFRSELIYKGVNHSEALFEVRHYLCGRFEPVGTERFGADLVRGKQVFFQGTCLTLLETNPSNAIVKIDLCKNDSK
jgi:hypothetical protein